MMDKFLKNKLLENFEFPLIGGSYDDNLLIYSYIGLTIMSRFANVSDEREIEDNYYANHREITSIAREVINYKWVDDKEVKEEDIKAVQNSMVLTIEKNMENFGHLVDFSLSSNSQFKNYVTQDDYYRYKDVCFKMGLPKALAGRKISGYTFLEPYSQNFAEYKIDSNIDVKLLIKAYENDFVEISSSSIYVQDLSKNVEKYSDSWVNIIESKDFKYNIGRKSENNHNVYYLLSKKGNKILGKRFEDNTFVSSQYEHRRIMFYIRKISSTPYMATIRHFDENYFSVSLPCNIPNYETNILYNIGWPMKNLRNRLNFIIRKEFETLVNDLLTNCYLEVNRK